MDKAKFAFLLLMTLWGTILCGEAWAEKRIGILLFSEEPRYEEAKKGILDQLKAEGYKAPGVKFIIEDADGNKAKAADLARKFADEKVDLIIPIGTNASIAASRQTKTIPIVFSMTFDAVESKIAKSWQSSGNNTTGTSAKVPMSRVVKELRAFTQVRKLAVVYTPGEKNSELHLKELQEVLRGSAIKVVPVAISSKEEVSAVLPNVIRTVDAIFLSGSGIVGSTVPTIVDMATQAKVVTVTFLDDLVEKGVLLGVCADSYAVGRLAGKKAARVLRGAKPSDIPIETLSRFDLMLNMKTAQAGGISIPPALKRSATNIIR